MNRKERDPGAPFEAPEGAEGAEPSEGTESTAAGAAVDFHDRWLRAEAELQNFRRRASRDLDDTRRRAEESVLLDLIAVLDDLERGVEAASEGGAPATWTQGVALVIQRGRDALARYGVEVVDPLGKPFDPHFHEAVLEVDPPQGTAPGTVTQVVQKGYRRGDRSLRAARVVVARQHAGDARS